MSLRVHAPAEASSSLSALPRLSRAAVRRFLQADEAVLILVRSDCPHCAGYLEDTDKLLGGVPSGAAVAALAINRLSGVRFRCDNPSIGGLGVFPYLVRYRRGRRVAGLSVSRTPGILALLAARLATPSERAA